jgi:hypothetical protein
MLMILGLDLRTRRGSVRAPCIRIRVVVRRVYAPWSRSRVANPCPHWDFVERCDFVCALLHSACNRLIGRCWPFRS